MASATQYDVSTLFSVKGIVAVISGGGSGLGSYAALALDANGAKAVYIVGRRKEALEKVASEATNKSIVPVVCDVTNKESLQQLADTIRKDHGHINLLFANAGVNGPRHADLWSEDVKNGSRKATVKDFQEAMWKPSMDDFTSAMHVNCTAVFYTTVALLDLLDAGNKAGNVAQRSQVLVTSSIAGFSRLSASGFSYSVSKGAVNHLIKGLSTQLAQYDIRVNGIAPGLFLSEMTNAQLSEREKSDQEKFPGSVALPKDRSPEERSGSKREFAGAVLYLTSQAGAYMNGEIMVIDGGRLSQLPSVY